CLVCLSVLAALAINRLQGRRRRIAVAVAVVGLLLDGWPREFSVRAEPEHRPSPPGVLARVMLPMTDDQNAASLYQQTLDGVPLYNGFSGYDAPHYYAMRQMFEKHDPAILQALTRLGPLGVVIDHEADPDAGYRR